MITSTTSKTIAGIAVVLSSLPAIHAQVIPVGVTPINVAKNINPSVTGEQLSHYINTPYMELGPLPTKDGERLYFSRQGFPGNTGGIEDEDIWYSEFNAATQSWGPAINAGYPLNNTGPNFITGVGRDGDTLLLANEYRKNGKMRAGVSVSVRVGELWSFPVPLSITADYNSAGRTSYDLSHDRNALIIAQEKADTYGRLDLYVSFRDPDRPDSYAGTESVNLGPTINTFGDETSPWLSYDGRTLYFASSGHNGYGNMDIFVARRLDNTWSNWSEPENLGPGINSAFDDFSFNYNPKSREAYFVRGFSRQNTDIFKIDMTNLFVDDDTNPVEIGKTKTVAEVFEDDRTEINDIAEKNLKQIVNYLKKNPSIIIQVTAHSNKHDNRTESFRLSNERAATIVDYLINNGIPKERLSYNGLGHDVVVNSNGNEYTHGIASAVEFKVVNYDH